MSKSEGNFYTLRDLLLRGYKASAIRFLLTSVPYRQQLNFTFEGLLAETGAVERLRTFHQRLNNTKWPESAAQPGVTSNDTIVLAASAAKEKFRAALANDLNTAEARAAIFDLVRTVNAAADAGSLLKKDVTAVLDALADFDKVFAVLEDNDAQWTRFALEWAEREGRLDEASPEVRAQLSLSDGQIEALIEERNQARRARNFARGDAIRKELLEKGILLEDSKEGVRWKRK